MKNDLPSTVRAVIFDLDGTLLNTLADLTAAVNHALRTCGYPARGMDEVRAFIGNGVVRLMQRAAPSGLSQPAWQTCFDCFRTYYLAHMTDCTVPYPGVLSLLDELHARGVRTAVVSNKLHAGVTGLCRDFFGNRIDCAFGVETEDERKPAPATTLRAMKALGSTAKNTVFVGDSEVDVQTAANAALPCIGARWGYRDGDALARAGAVAVIDRPEDLLGLLFS